MRLHAIASAALHDIFCAIWLLIYMGVRGRLGDTLAALKTRSGKAVILGALWRAYRHDRLRDSHQQYRCRLYCHHLVVLSCSWRFLAFVFLKERMALSSSSHCWRPLPVSSSWAMCLPAIGAGQSDPRFVRCAVVRLGWGFRSRHLRLGYARRVPIDT